MVRPTVEFASCVWDTHERVDINTIEMVQRRGARFVKHRYHNISSVTDLLEDLKWKSLETRRKESRLTMMYKIVNKQVAINPDRIRIRKLFIRSSRKLIQSNNEKQLGSGDPY